MNDKKAVFLFLENRTKQKILIFLCFVFSMILFGFPSNSCAMVWQQIKGDHFVVNYFDDKKFAEEVLAKAEVYYSKIAERLGFERYADFWTWTKRVNIFIYPNHESFLQNTGQMDWSDGKADIKNKQISMYAGNPKFLEAIVPHEMGHLIFRDFIGFKNEVPLWLDEGVATLCEEGTYENTKNSIKDFYSRSALLTLEDMMTLNFKKNSSSPSVHDIIMKNNMKGYLSLTPANFITLFYLEATSIVGFLIERYGPVRFSDFCRELRDGKTINQALANVYPDDCPSIKELEEKWRQSIEEEKISP